MSVRVELPVPEDQQQVWIEWAVDVGLDPYSICATDGSYLIVDREARTATYQTPVLDEHHQPKVIGNTIQTREITETLPAVIPPMPCE